MGEVCDTVCVGGGVGVSVYIYKNRSHLQANGQRCHLNFWPQVHELALRL